MTRAPAGGPPREALCVADASAATGASGAASGTTGPLAAGSTGAASDTAGTLTASALSSGSDPELVSGDSNTRGASPAVSEA